MSSWSTIRFRASRISGPLSEVGEAPAGLEEGDVPGEILDALDAVAAKEPPAPPVDRLALEVGVVRGHALAADTGTCAAVLAVALENALRADDPEALVDDGFELLRQDPARVERKGGSIHEVDFGVDTVVGVEAVVPQEGGLRPCGVDGLRFRLEDPAHQVVEVDA